ncbi:MAG: tetratricopeptide repeat protein [Muribaculaceae bacterium]|nr:tetratricopeptide repeat protein [Muribaculaceae bacterium]
MAKENKEGVRTSIDNLNDSLTGIEQRVQNNQKIILWFIIGIAAVVVLIFGYIYLIHKPSVEAANNAIGQADIELFNGNDSIAAEKYMKVADEFGHDAGNRAALSAAILLYQQKRYEDALNYLRKYDSNEEVIGASALSLEGDCYVNLKQYDNALKSFRAAVDASDKNPHYTPFFMMKEATVLRELKDYKAEAAVYAEIIKEYPTYGDENRIDLEKYLRRAELAAGETK